MKERKNKSLARKIAVEVINYYGAYDDYDEAQNGVIDSESEKALAKVIKRVIRKHDSGK